MREIILIKDGELALKGLNRRNFESTMTANIHRRLKDLGAVNIRRAQSTLYIEPQADTFDFDEALARVGRIFGIAGFSRACVCEKTVEDITAKAPDYLAGLLQGITTFKVESKRADKRFPLTSLQLSAEVGAALSERFPHLRVDVHHPQLTVQVEVRDFAAYIHGAQQKGAGGLPVGTAGRAMVLISGGIDSPVAAWTMAKRGLTLSAVHFASPPYTSPRAEQKVCDLLAKVARYSGGCKLAIVPFTEIQEQIGQHCPEDYFTLIMRRLMMRIACRLAEENGCPALITGESLGQVASQTLLSLAATEAVCDRPILRPLIGMDKEEIVRISKMIDTFETSILPFEDCCTVFTPRHPHTRPKKGQCEAAEAAVNWEPLIEKALAQVRWMWIDADGVGRTWQAE